MVKHVDTAVFNATQNVVDEEFNGGEVTALGLERDGVEAVIGTEYEGEIPSGITDALASSKDAINNGEIDVPTDPENA